MKLSSMIKGVLLGGVTFAMLASTALAQTQLRISLGAYQNLSAIYENAARQFETENPGIKIELLHSGSRAFNESLASAAMANDLPDVVLFDAPYLANYAWSGILQPLESFSSPR